MERLHKLFIYRKKLIAPYIQRCLTGMNVFTYLMSAMFLMALVYEHGFLLQQEDLRIVHGIYHFVWIIFLIDTTLHLLLNYSATRRKYKKLTWVLSILLYLTLLPVIFHDPMEEGFVRNIWLFFHHRLYHLILLTLLSLLQLSNGIIRLLGKRTNPSLIRQQKTTNYKYPNDNIIIN